MFYEKFFQDIFCLLSVSGGVFRPANFNFILGDGYFTFTLSPGDKIQIGNSA